MVTASRGRRFFNIKILEKQYIFSSGKQALYLEMKEMWIEMG